METNDLREISKDITTYLALTNNPDTIYNFIRDLLSQTEIKEFSRRFEVAKLLTQKVSYAQIEKQTGMSSTTIARISKFLTGENKGYTDAISTLQSITAKHHEGHQS